MALSVQGGPCYAATEFIDSSMGAVTSSDLLLVGAFAPTVNSATWLTLTLATDELNQGGDGLPTSAGVHRPVLVVACDDAPGSAEAAASHLAALQVSAWVAPQEQRSVEALLPLLANRSPGLLLAPNGFELRPNQTGAELLWSLGAPGTALAPAYPAFIRLLGAAAAGGGAPGALARVAMLASEAPEDQQLVAAVRAALYPDDRELTRAMIEDRYREFTLSDAAPTNRAQTLESLASYAPHVIVVSSGGYFADADRRPRSTAIASIEELAAAGSEWAPFYLFGPRNAGDAFIRQLLAAGTSLRSRSLFISAQPMPSAPLADDASARFAASYPGALPGVGLEPGTYDAVHYLAYALAAAPRIDGAPRAADVRVGLEIIASPGSERVDVGPGPNGLERARALLEHQTPFDLVSTSGPADFDARRLRSTDVRGYCWSAGGALELAVTYDSSAMAVTRPAGPASDLAECALEVLGEAAP